MDRYVIVFWGFLKELLLSTFGLGTFKNRIKIKQVVYLLVCIIKATLSKYKMVIDLNNGYNEIVNPACRLLLC